MLDLQRHMYCPIWTDVAVQPTESPPYTATTQQWTGLKYACQKVLETYCKLFDEKELYDLIVRYTCKTMQIKYLLLHKHTYIYS